MPLRTFRDSNGAEWSAWDVAPRAVERRIAERRVLAEPTARERRERERRLSLGRPAELFSRFGQAWLCFDGQRERRRLMHVPDGWAQCSDAELERYLGEARPVRALAFTDSRPTTAGDPSRSEPPDRR